MTNDLAQRIGELVAAGRTIDAIKLLREQRGLGLWEAKDLLDRAMPAPAGAAKRGCLLPLLFGCLLGLSVAVAVTRHV